MIFKKYRKKVFALLALCAAVFLVLTWWANHTIELTTKDFVTTDISQLPDTKAALLLGTGKLLKDGRLNAYFYHRIQAATELYHSGKIKCIIISGDNGREGYDEPNDMKNELLKNGVPDSVIYLDYAGFRTLDSVVRAKEIFGQDSLIIISQKFHNERAVYIAREKGLVAYGYNAKDVTALVGFKTKVREFFARGKVYVDLFFGVQPKFLGEKVTIK